MRVLVTGASGNIGTALLAALRAAQPAWEVSALCRRPPTATPPYDVAEWHSLDLLDPRAPEVLPRLLDGADAVVHLA